MSQLLEPELEAEGLEFEVSHGGIGRPMNASGQNPSVSAGIAAANALAAGGMPPEAGWRVPRFPGEDGGHSLADMAQRDLDAALQLLADRAQYITGAGGAAIALRRDERNDMLCRASAGSKAPELGALLSTESGLSGESVRTRRPLRCDDAEHDPRVNQESCRDLGIASVMIVPILGENLRGDGQVLGVFELFSGQAGAFAERDLSALQRLGGMVETAVMLAQAAQSVPLEVAVRDLEPPILADDEPVLEVDIDEEAGVRADAFIRPARTKSEDAYALLPDLPTADPVPAIVTPLTTPQTTAVPNVPALAASAPIPEVVAQPQPVMAQPPKRPLMWSAATVQTNAEAPKSVETDQSHVPPMLRNLRKCKACGFPVSEGRTLCVECDEKQWRGQPLSAAARATDKALPAVDFRQSGVAAGVGESSRESVRSSSASSGLPVSTSLGSTLPRTTNRVVPKVAPESVEPLVSRASAPISAPGLVSARGAIAGSAAAAAAAAAQARVGPQRVAPQSLEAALAELREQETRLDAARREPAAASARTVESAAAAVVPEPKISAPAAAKTVEPGLGGALVEPVGQVQPNPASLNFSGGLEGRESWLAANKYILGVILVIAAGVAAVVWLR